MKSIIKKLFSLLLVGVVVISMISSIKPNCVDAAETNVIDSETIFILYSPDSGPSYFAFSILSFYDLKENSLGNPRNIKLGGRRPLRKKVAIPKATQKIIIETNIMTDKMESSNSVSTFERSEEKICGKDGPPIQVEIRSPSDPESPGVAVKVMNDNWYMTSQEDNVFF